MAITAKPVETTLAAAAPAEYPTDASHIELAAIVWVC